MNDKALADALVEAEIVQRVGQNEYLVPGTRSRWSTEDIYTAQEIVNDWRVAGACLERLTPEMLNTWIARMRTLFVCDLLKDPRAICEAYAESLK